MKPIHKDVLQIAAISLLAVALGCNGNLSLFGSPTQDAGDRPSPGATPSPSPSPSASPTATPGSTPSPSPSPTPSCAPQILPFTCVTGEGLLGADVARVQASVPNALEAIYVANLVDALNRDAKLCAQAGPSSDEVTVKARDSNAVSESWDVKNVDGSPQTIPANPGNICRPSRF